MPRLEIDIDDKGEFVGAVPAELDAILKRIEATAISTGYGKGAQKAAEEAKQQIADAVRAEKLKLEMQAPLERAKFEEIDQMNAALKAQLEAVSVEARKTLTAREEAHAREITKRVEALNARNARIQALVNDNLKALAAQAGAREESLSELEVILQHRIGYDDNMTPFVKGEDGQPAKTAAGNPLSVDVFVKQYLDNHPHHRKPLPGMGGGARGGAFRAAAAAPSQTADAVRQKIDAGDRSATAINELYEATRRRKTG